MGTLVMVYMAAVTGKALTTEQRVQRMQEVIGRCGIENKACMRELLGQAEGATDEDLVRF